MDHAPLLERLGYHFKKPDLLQQALTHPSAGAARQSRQKAEAQPYERLEFLGDRVLGLIIAEWLYEAYPEAPEGVLARHLAALVRRDSLVQIASDINLLPHLTRAKGTSDDDVRGHATILGDAVEALLGAIYLDSDLATVKDLVRRLFATVFTAQRSAPPDPKTTLQEWAQARGLALPVYTILKRSGPSHAPLFEIDVKVGMHPPARATGPSKQEAEKAAAAALLKELQG